MSRVDYFGTPRAKRLPPVKCSDCGRVVAGERAKGGKCLGCVNHKTEHWAHYIKTDQPVSGGQS